MDNYFCRSVKNADKLGFNSYFNICRFLLFIQYFDVLFLCYAGRHEFHHQSPLPQMLGSLKILLHCLIKFLFPFFSCYWDFVLPLWWTFSSFHIFVKTNHNSFQFIFSAVIWIVSSFQVARPVVFSNIFCFIFKSCNPHRHLCSRFNIL